MRGFSHTFWTPDLRMPSTGYSGMRYSGMENSIAAAALSCDPRKPDHYSNRVMFRIICCAEDCHKQTRRRCTGCKFVVYCDEQCQLKDWLIHKHECKILKRQCGKRCDPCPLITNHMREEICPLCLNWSKESKESKDVRTGT